MLMLKNCYSFHPHKKSSCFNMKIFIDNGNLIKQLSKSGAC